MITKIKDEPKTENAAETPKAPEKRKKSTYWRTFLIIFAVTVILALLGFVPSFCDWYTNNIYIYLCDGLSYITDPVPFVAGEMMMYLGNLMLLLSVIFLVLLIFLRKKPKYRRFCGGYFKTFLMMLLCVLFIYMPMWYIPFRSTVMGEGDRQKRTDFTYDEIYALLEFSVNGLNEAAEEIEIGADGKAIFPTVEETQPLIAEALVGISDEFPRLRGFYPSVKPALCSDILNRMWIGGYTYPFTMEATHNKYISPTYQPVLDAHELTHHKGYYKENEAEFLSQIALSRSDDPLLRFSAYNQMYDFVWEEWSDTVEVMKEQIILEMIEKGECNIVLHPDNDEDAMRNIEILEKLERDVFPEIFGKEPEISDKAMQILMDGYEAEEEIYEADSHPIDDMPAVNEVIEETADVGWETQGEILQENTYDGVTLLLLQYFDGKL